MQFILIADNIYKHMNNNNSLAWAELEGCLRNMFKK